MLGLVAQSLLAAFFVSTIVTSNLVSALIASLTQAIPYGIDLLSLGSPVCLFVTSKNLRRHYCEFYGICERKGTSVTPAMTAPQQRTVLKLDDLRTLSVN
ncbi:hypothetical protein AAVH_06664 [Aphelenchoides avenae]|nr:hypothetical protein AAVH_06664 [Aphelenchus avenae]